MARGRSIVGGGGRRSSSSGEQRAVVSGARERRGLASAYGMVLLVVLHVAVILGSGLCDRGGGSRGSIYCCYRAGIVTSLSLLHSGHGFIHQKRRESTRASRTAAGCVASVGMLRQRRKEHVQCAREKESDKDTSQPTRPVLRYARDCVEE
jgi:hypothetical protein